jgi:low temperature requirement protein LtrA
LWWSYFKHESTEGLRASLRTTMAWAYGHYALFASVAALGAGLELAVDAAGHAGEVPDLVTGFAVAVPVAVFLVVAAATQGRLSRGSYLGSGWAAGTAVLVLAAGALTGVLGIAAVVAVAGVLVALLVAANLVAAHRRALRRTAN